MLLNGGRKTMLNLINNITLILGYSTYIVIAYIVLLLCCGKIEQMQEKRKIRKQLKTRQKRLMDILKNVS